MCDLNFMLIIQGYTKGSIPFCKKYKCHKNFNVYFVFLFTKIYNYVRTLQQMFKLSSFNFDTLKIVFGIGFYHSPQKRKVLKPGIHLSKNNRAPRRGSLGTPRCDLPRNNNANVLTQGAGEARHVRG